MRPSEAVHHPRTSGQHAKFWECRRIDEDLVVGEAADGEVGTRVGLRRLEKGWIERKRAQQVDSTPRDPLPEMPQCRIRPDTPVVLRANGMHGHEGAEAPGARRAGRCRQKQRRLRCARTLERHVVPSGGDRPSRDRREVERELDVRAARIGAPRPAAQGGGERRSPDVAILEFKTQPDVVVLHAGREGGRHGGRSIDPLDQHRLELTATRRFLLLAQDLACVVGRRQGHPECVEKGDDDLGVCVLAAALDVLIRGLNAVETGERCQILTQTHASDPRMERIPRAGISTHVGRLFIS